MDQKQQIEQRLVEKAMKDEQFREQLRVSPKETIEAELGIKLPQALNIHVLEEKPDSVFLVLPADSPNLAEDELSEAELEGVAGGWSGDTECGTCDGCPM
jgi:hypothetical protein